MLRANNCPEDTPILSAAITGIEALNRKYVHSTGQKFHLFHRRRQWNDREHKWMGWERKRGKLEEFNKLLRGDKNTSFTGAPVDVEFLKATKYVITLDSDTQLPRDAARKLIGIAIHPLNRPHFDEKLQRIIKGYGILQPRISISLTSASQSYFSRIFSGNTGIDPYTTASSDIYQDLFGEGSFTGKGLYDVDAFSAALKDRVPENSILSHDLFEGLYARCGLVTDIELLDDFPTHFDTFAKRSHRWVRGDWQIAGWLLPWVQNSQGKSVRNELPVISRWKIFDNLRRSLVAPAMIVCLLMIWTVFPGSRLLWTLFIVFVLAFPVYAHLQTNVLTHPRGIPWTSHFWSVLGNVKTNTWQVLIVLAMLPYQAYQNSDAVIRTVYRVFVSHKNLLEWKTAAQSEVDSKQESTSYLRSMGAAIAVSAIFISSIVWFHPSALLIAAPFLIFWIFSPLIAYRMSIRPPDARIPITGSEIKMARMIARRTWRFFETFVNDDSNWLPPDNFQEDPVPKIAHRTSPTNIGLLLLSTISAHDFGYLGTLELSERLGLTFATLEKLEKVRGYYLNWYDTQTLEPLSPRYISSVDSGNLAGHLLAVKQSVTEIANRKLLDTHVMEGLTDSLEMMRYEANKMNVARRRTEGVTVRQLNSEINACFTLVESNRIETPDAWFTVLESLISHIEVISDITAALTLEHGSIDFTELGFWSSDLSHQARTFLRDIKTFIPWRESDFSHLSEIISHDFPAIQIDRSLTTGSHGLPLMGSGDWNDGMSSVGNKGLGESVWVGWFLINTLTDFMPFCSMRDESERYTTYLKHKENLKKALEKDAWDGNWFRRAYFDDGTPLGSAEDEECKIDSIAQSWSVISGGANPQQAARAMASVDEYLIRRGDGIVLLFTPPFDKSPVNPGYIKGYLPGVRENGGQYTHAAIWTMIAFTMLGDGDKAGELFALLNPISHASTRAGLHKYKVEPYVVAGDVYNEPKHIGRGGWTWYTGAASWMYRAALESMLGFHLTGETLRIEPCVPRSWRNFEISYRRGQTLYKISVENPTGICRGVVEVRLDGKLLKSGDIPLTDDGQTHQVSIVMGAILKS